MSHQRSQNCARKTGPVVPLLIAPGQQHCGHLVASVGKVHDDLTEVGGNPSPRSMVVAVWQRTNLGVLLVELTDRQPAGQRSHSPKTLLSLDL